MSPARALDKTLFMVHTDNEFEWDERKNLANALKHGIRFEHAQQAFDDPGHIIQEDTEHSTDTEKRHWLIGRAGVDVLLIVFTRRRNRVRLISARSANKQERSPYEQRKTKDG